MWWNSKARLLAILDLAPGNIYWKDIKGIYRGANANLPPSIGLTKEGMIGKRDHDFLPKDAADHVVKIDNIVFDTGKEFTAEEFYTCPTTGKTTTYLTKKTPLFDNKGRIYGLLGVSFDITERKQQEKALAEALEKAEAGNNAKTVFISSVSHDMRTPLTGILGALELIKHESNQSPKFEQIYLGAKKCGQTLLNMINRVMDFAQREYAGLTVHKEEVNLNQLAIDCLNMYEITAQKKGIKLNLDYQGQDFFNTDYHRMQEILLNLIGNAVKFTEEGEVSVMVNSADKAIKIQVQDTGIGISEDMHEAIFDRFTRVERSDRSKYPGYGLGLAKVKTSVDALEGEILVTSEPGKGSIFEVYIGV